MSALENCLISTYLLRISTRVQMEKNWGDTPSVRLNNFAKRILYGMYYQSRYFSGGFNYNM